MKYRGLTQLYMNDAPGNQGDINKVAKRTVRRSMFPRIPEEVFVVNKAPGNGTACHPFAPQNNGAQQIKSQGKDMEANLFPHLYPKGTGYWVEGKGDASRTFEEDTNIKVYGADLA